ncbi:putative nucleic acid binding protein [Trypoxylus dichotomus]
MFITHHVTLASTYYWLKYFYYESHALFSNLKKVKCRGAQKQTSSKLTQADDPLTIQGQLEIGLKLLNPANTISVVTSSRTDAGVHALHSTMHVDLTGRNNRPYNPMPSTFHCRKNATSRTYMYRLVIVKADSLHVAPHLHHIPIEEHNRALYLCTNTFDIDKFKDASQLFLGLHDFRTFMGKGSQQKDKITRRVIDRLDIEETAPIYYHSYSWPCLLTAGKSPQDSGCVNSCSTSMVGTRVYVGGLPYGTTERDLERFFRGYGRMRDVLIKNGYGFVEFDDHRDADDAVYELNGKKLLGERVTVEKARGTPRGRDQWSSRNDYRSHERYGPPTRTNHRLIVENLSSRVSWQDLKDYMRQAGEVTYADAHKQHRNEGVVEFASYSDMKNALEKLDDTEINGRRIRLVEDRSGYRSSKSAIQNLEVNQDQSRIQPTAEIIANQDPDPTLIRNCLMIDPVPTLGRSPTISLSRDLNQYLSLDLNPGQGPDHAQSTNVLNQETCPKIGPVRDLVPEARTGANLEAVHLQRTNKSLI